MDNTGENEKRWEKPLYALPAVLWGVNFAVFYMFTLGLGPQVGYLVAFAFYWAFWGVFIPWRVIGWGGLKGLFREESPFFTKRNGVAILLFFAVIGGTVGLYVGDFFVGVSNLPLLLIAIPLSLIGPTCEEIVWRGLYVRIFATKPVSACLYPAVGFALWHIIPALFSPEPTDIPTFVLSTFFLGLVYSIIAYLRKSIKWTVISHVIGSIFAFASPLAAIILTL